MLTTASCSQARVSGLHIPAVRQAAGKSVITVDLTHLGGPLKKAGLGSLFGVSSLAGGTPKALIAGSLLNVSASQGRIGENGSNPFSTEAVAPIIRGTGAHMICRFNDLCYGFDPYVWPGLSEWLRQVSAAAYAVDGYKDVVYAVAPFNEPDNKFWRAGTPPNAFMTDPALPNGSYDAKVNWLWTQTVRTIRGIDPGLKIMGPNYENYRPWERDGADQARMTAFLQNAMATETVPNIIGWHSLGPSPGDVPFGLDTYYRPLEQSLALPGRPKAISVEEYGPNTGDFEGVPSTMVKHWAELERAGVDFADMGIYANGGLLGNTLRYPWQTDLKPNGGWWMMHWYRQMQGRYAPVSRWDTRHYQSFDGVASWDASAKTATLILGGADEDADVQVQGVKSVSLGPTVRVRLDCTVWDVDPNQRDKTPEHGGDPQTGTYNFYDKTLPLDVDGNLDIPIHRLEGYNGYRLLISPAAKPDVYPTKYEAEAAHLTHAAIHSGADAVPLASGNAYVGGMDFPDSAVQFNNVTAPARGIYVMTVRYADGGSVAATQNVRVNGSPQGAVNYLPTTGWSHTEMRTVAKRVALEQGRNTLTLSKGTGSAEIDFIDVRPDTHRYDAEFALVHDGKPALFAHEINVPNYVGGLNALGSYVELAIDAPKTGSYRLAISYANGTAAVSRLNLTLNGIPASPVSFAPTGGWLGAPNPMNLEKRVSIPISLREGVNQVRLQKSVGFVEMDYVRLSLSAKKLYSNEKRAVKTAATKARNLPSQVRSRD